MGLATLSYAESYQIREPVLHRFFFDGVTETMVLRGSCPYQALRPDDIGAECIDVTPTSGGMIGVLGLVITAAQPPSQFVLTCELFL